MHMMTALEASNATTLSAVVGPLIKRNNPIMNAMPNNTNALVIKIRERFNHCDTSVIKFSYCFMLLSRLSFSFSETSILCIKNLLVVFEIRITVEPGVIMIRIVKT